MSRPLVILGILVLTGICWAEQPATILIVPFDNEVNAPGPRSLEKGIPDLLTSALENYSQKIHVVEREKLESLISEKSLEFENLALKSSGRMQAMGQMLQARYILNGAFAEQNKILRIQAQLYDTETTQLIKVFKNSGTVKSLSRMSEQLAAEIATTVLSKKSELPIDSDPQANLFFAKGLGYYHQSQFSKAIPEFMKILAKNPKNADAKYWLIKSYLGAGSKDHAKLESDEFMKVFPDDPRVKEFQKEKLQ